MHSMRRRSNWWPPPMPSPTRSIQRATRASSSSARLHGSWKCAARRTSRYRVATPNGAAASVVRVRCERALRFKQSVTEVEAQMRLHPRLQGWPMDRLGDVIVGAKGKASGDHFAIVLGADHDDRQLDV